MPGILVRSIPEPDAADLGQCALLFPRPSGGAAALFEPLAGSHPRRPSSGRSRDADRGRELRVEVRMAGDENHLDVPVAFEPISQDHGLYAPNVTLERPVPARGRPRWPR